jgi:hypothetical protein
LAVKVPQSLAANSGKAVMVNAALEILALTRRSWVLPDAVRDSDSPFKAAI